MIIPDFAVISDDSIGFYEFLEAYGKHEGYDYQQNRYKIKYFGYFDGGHFNVNDLSVIRPNFNPPILTPSEAIALLTGKQLTEGERQRDVIKDLLPTQESVKGEDESIGFKKYLLELIPIQTYAHDFPQNFSAREIIKMADKYSTQQTAHLQQQLKKANLLLLNIKNTIELNNIQKVFPETYPQINQFLSRH